ncbi:MAG: hypothetical protein AAFO91_16880, partial [Bacteroidota bacterium]
MLHKYANKERQIDGEMESCNSSVAQLSDTRDYVRKIYPAALASRNSQQETQNPPLSLSYPYSFDKQRVVFNRRYRQAREHQPHNNGNINHHTPSQSHYNLFLR